MYKKCVLCSLEDVHHTLEYYGFLYWFFFLIYSFKITATLNDPLVWTAQNNYFHKPTKYTVLHYTAPNNTIVLFLSTKCLEKM